MDALVRIALVYAALFVLFGFGNVKRFLLVTGIVSLPFKTSYPLVYFGAYQGWTSGILLVMSDVSFVVLLAYVLIARPDHTEAPLRMLLPIGAFLAAACLSLVNSHWPWMSVFMVIMVAKIALLYYFVFIKSVVNVGDLEAVLAGFTLSLIVQGSIAVLQFTTGQPHDYFTVGATVEGFHEIGIAVLRHRVVGTVGKPNSLAGLITPYILLNIALLMGDPKRRILRLTSVVLGLTALVLTFSRGGWLGFATAFLLFVFLAWRNRLLGAKAFAATVLVGSVFASLFWAGVESRLTEDDHNSAMSRVPLMQIAVKMIEDHPVLGIGPNTARSMAKHYAIKAGLRGIYLQQVHNQYLLVFAEMGIVGLAAFLWLLGACFREAGRCMVAPRMKEPYAIAFGIRMGFIASAVHMMVDLYNSHLFLASLAMLTGVLTVTSRLVEDDIEELQTVRVPLVQHDHERVRAELAQIDSV